MGLGRAIRAGSLTGCVGILIHSLVDFNLHIPSNALLFLLFAGTATATIWEPPSIRHMRSTADSTPAPATANPPDRQLNSSVSAW